MVSGCWEAPKKMGGELSTLAWRESSSANQMPHTTLEKTDDLFRCTSVNSRRSMRHGKGEFN